MVVRHGAGIVMDDPDGDVWHQEMLCCRSPGQGIASSCSVCLEINLICSIDVDFCWQQLGFFSEAKA